MALPHRFDQYFTFRLKLFIPVLVDNWSQSPPQNTPIIEGISVSPKNGGKIKSEVRMKETFLYKIDSPRMCRQ